MIRLFLAFLCFVSTAQGIVITRTSSPVFYFDNGATPALQGMYVAYKVFNDSGVTYPDLWAQVDNFSGAVISLAPGEDGLMHLGSLAPGQTKAAFFYLQASAVTATLQTHTVHVFTSRPPLGTELASANYSMTAEDTIEANANKVVTVVTGPNPPELGGIVTMTVSGESGTIGAGGILAFSPAAWLNWRPDAYELYETTITLSGGNNGTYTDQLLINAASSSATEYVAVYRFRAVNTTDAPTVVSPIAFISSGENVKHTTTGTYGSLQPILPSDNRLTLGKGASVLELIDGGEVTFSLWATNSGSYDSLLEDFVDTLPTSPATGSVT